MANVGSGIGRLLIDQSGDPITDDSSNALKVKLVDSIDSIDIGDVSLLLGGTAASVNAGTMDTGTLRVTLATDDTHFGAVGGSAVVDGTVHEQLRYIGNNLNTTTINTAACDSSLNNIESYTGISIKATGTEFGTSDVGSPAVTVRNDTLANLDGNIASGDYSMLQTNAVGALYVTGESKQNIAVTDYGFGIMGEAKIIDGSALPNAVGEGNASRLAVSRAGVAYTCLTDDAGAQDIGASIANVIGTSGSTGPTKCVSMGATEAGGNISELTIASGKLLVTDANSASIKTAVELIDNAIDGSEMQVDIVSSPELTVNLGSTDNAVLDAIAASLALLDNSIASGNELQVDIVSAPTLTINSPAVTNAGTFAVQVDGDALTSLQLLDDVIYVDDADFDLNTDKGIVVMGYAGTQTISSGDVGAIKLTTTGLVEVNATIASNWGAPGGTGNPVQAASVTYNAGDPGITVMGVVNFELEHQTLVGDGEWTHLQIDQTGALYTTHGMTGMVSDLNNDVGTSAEKIHAAADIAIKRIDIVASVNNTGEIFVGDSGVAGNGGGGGIRLQPGDFYSLDIDNTADVYVAAEVDGEDVHYNYFT